MKKLGTTARTILSHLTVAGPTRRKDLLASVKPAGKSTNWGNSYFLPTFESGNGARSSLLAKGYILRVGRGLYTITPKGMGALAQ